MKLYNLISLFFITIIISACSTQASKPQTSSVIRDGDIVYNGGSHTEEELSRGSHNSTQTPRPLRPAPTRTYQSSSDNVWTTLANNFSFQQDFYRYEVDQVVNKFAFQQAYFDRLNDNAQFYLAYIVNQTQLRNMPLEIALLPIIESTLNPFAISGSSAKGMWQFMKPTGNIYNLYSSNHEDSRRDIIKSTQAGLDYLEKMYAQFGDWYLAMAAYNGGPGTIQRAQNANYNKGLSGDFWSLKLSRETREYVPKILAMARIVQDPYSHGISLKPINSDSSFTSYALTGAFSLSQIAACAELDFESFYRYNPQYRKVNTKHKLHDFILPLSHSDIFYSNISQGVSSCPSGSEYTAQKVMDKLAGRKNNHIYTAPKPKPKPIIVKKVIPEKPAVTTSDSSINHAIESEIKNTSTSQRKQVTHILKSGETIWRVSQNYDVPLEDLKRWNKITDTTNIATGRRLIIWK